MADLMTELRNLGIIIKTYNIENSLFVILNFFLFRLQTDEWFEGH